MSVTIQFTIMFVFAAVALGERPELQAPMLDSLARELLGTSEAQLEVYRKGAELELIEVAPVNLPDNPPGDCNHYGWPVATAAGDMLVVMHRRIPGHRRKGAGDPHEKMSYGILTSSSTSATPTAPRACSASPAHSTRRNWRTFSRREAMNASLRSVNGYCISRFRMPVSSRLRSAGQTVAGP